MKYTIIANSNEGSSPELRMSQTSSTPDDNSKEEAFVVATTAESETTTDKLEASTVQFSVPN